MNRKEIEQKILNMFADLLLDDQDMWILNYCPSEQAKIQRVHDDNQYLQEFIKLLKQLTD